jgi:hypothetical protein
LNDGDIVVRRKIRHSNSDFIWSPRLNLQDYLQSIELVLKLRTLAEVRVEYTHVHKIECWWLGGHEIMKSLFYVQNRTDLGKLFGGSMYDGKLARQKILSETSRIWLWVARI